MKKFIHLLPLAIFYWLGLFQLGAQNSVSINPHIQRYVGNVSVLDRSKYFTIHNNGTSAEETTFYTDYNVTRGRGFWGPYAYAKGQTGTVGVYPANKSGDASVRAVTHYIATEHPNNVFVDGLDANAAGDWAVEYFKNFTNNAGRPQFFEPMNEPFVHASDFYAGGWNASEEARIKLQMAQVYNAIGQKIHAASELANIEVIGYSGAWPSFELNDFGHWNDNMKMFMDVAGQNMDGLSVHLYDGVNISGQDNKRSGSNAEAILDLMESYSYEKWGAAKQLAITEYGAIEQGYGTNYSDTASAQTMKSINHILFNLLEREDKLAISIPFITGKAEWHLTQANNYQPYGAVLWKPTNIGEPVVAGWEYTPRIHFYELWKNVQGTRVQINSNNPDIQTQAFVNGPKLYVALNNLDDTTQLVNLDFVEGLSGFQSVRVKRLKVHTAAMPEMTNVLEAVAPDSIALIAGETSVLEYTFSSNITFSNVLRKTTYYSGKNLDAIVANTAIPFSFNSVNVGTGSATLRMSIGRKHNVSKSPTITVNGNNVTVPSNWKGYDQANRDDFFGTLEIPVPMAYLQTNNTVNVTFPDGGGHLASLVLSVQKYDVDMPVQTAYPNAVAHVLPGTVEFENYDHGGEGVAYHDVDAANQGYQGRINEGVDLDTCNEGGLLVGYTVNGEWLEYTVDVAATKTYNLAIRYAANTASQISIASDGTGIGGAIDLPATGGWQTFQTLSLPVSLTAGQQVLRFNINQAGINLNKFVVSEIAMVDAFSFNPIITTMVSAASMDFSVDYSATVDRDLVVEFWSAQGWQGSTRKSVLAGVGSTTVNVTLNSAPTPGSGYLVKGSIRPSGGDWTTSLVAKQMTNITITAAPPTNLLVNGDVETGDLTGWQSTGSLMVANTNMHAGSAALSLTGSSMAYQTVSVQANTNYVLVAWVKVSAADQTAFLGVKDHGAASTSTPVSFTSYAYVTHRFKTGPSATTATVFLEITNAAHQAYGDDFVLYDDTYDVLVNVPQHKLSAKLYPNPTSDILYVHTFESGDHPVLVSVYSSLGKQVLYKQVQNARISLKGLAKGVYLVEIKSGTKISRQMISKK